MSPSQLRTQCVRIWKHGVELLHLLEISHRKAFAKLLLQFLGNILQRSFSIVGPKISVLLMLYDDAPDMPIRLNQRVINDVIRLIARRQKRFFDL